MLASDSVVAAYVPTPNSRSACGSHPSFPHPDDHPILREYSALYSTSRANDVLTRVSQSPDCQKAHWSSHKAICQHTASQISSAKQPGSGLIDESLVKNLRKFVSAHSTLLGWTGFQALQLKRLPSNIRQNALLVELSYRPSSSDPLRRSVDLPVPPSILRAAAHDH